MDLKFRFKFRKNQFKKAFRPSKTLKSTKTILIFQEN